jgi:cyclohexanecarboxyl-CoA dehydrogenase
MLDFYREGKMEFTYSKEEAEIKNVIYNFVQSTIEGKGLDKKKRIPKDIIELMAKIDLFSLKIPHKYGGLSARWVEMGIVIEELSKGATGLAYFVVLAWIVSQILNKYATATVKKKWLPEISKGNKFGCVSVSEPACGSDLAALKTISYKEGKNYVLNGEKAPVSFGFQSDFAIVFAKNEPGEKNGLELSAFLIPFEIPGIGKKEIPSMGLLSANLTGLELKNVKVPDTYRIGAEGEGNEINTDGGFCSDFFQILSGLIPMGIAQKAINLAIRHSKMRKAFGRSIIQFQAISEKIAEATTLIEMGRWLCYRALWLKDIKQTNIKESAMCCWWCPKAAYRIIEDMLLIHGHIGYSEEYPLEQMLRDVIAFEMIGGSAESMKMIISQRVVGKDIFSEFLDAK